LLIDELRVNSRAEILPTCRLVTPEVCAMSEKVGAAGIEPDRAVTHWITLGPTLPALCRINRGRERTATTDHDQLHPTLHLDGGWTMIDRE
jgi:hypothetical protein